MDFLKRLGILIFVFFVWCSLCVALPWVFVAIGAAILIAAVVSMARSGGVHDAGVFFSSVAVGTLLLSGGGFWVHQAVATTLNNVVAETTAGVTEQVAGEAAPAEEAKAEPEAAPEAAPAGGASDAIASANAVVKDKARCADIDAVVEAWALLGNVHKKDKEFAKAKVAARGLEACRKKAAAKLDKKQRKSLLASKGMAKPLVLR